MRLKANKTALFRERGSIILRLQNSAGLGFCVEPEANHRRRKRKDLRPAQKRRVTEVQTYRTDGRPGHVACASEEEMITGLVGARSSSRT